MAVLSFRGVLTFGLALLILSYAAEKSKLLVAEDTSSVTGRKFSWLDCFDMGLGSLGCLAKESTKLYSYNLKARYVEQAKSKAYATAYQAALNAGLSSKVAAQEAQGAGLKAAKFASRNAKRVTGPLFAACWDFFEVIYYGGSFVEGVVRAVGTMGGTWYGGYYGEQGLGRVGYFIGSQLGSWAGGRIGLMVYDIFTGLRFLLSGMEEFLSLPDESDDGSLESEAAVAEL